jgi:hypothetical protein
MDGFRFFRDDRLLELYAERVQCSHCERWLYPDEKINSYLGENLCKECYGLISGRIRILKNPERKTCPINPESFIFSKENLRSNPAGDRLIKTDIVLPRSETCEEHTQTVKPALNKHSGFRRITREMVEALKWSDTDIEQLGFTINDFYLVYKNRCFFVNKEGRVYFYNNENYIDLHYIVPEWGKK